MSDLDFYDSDLRPWPNNRLDDGLIVGHTTSTQSRIWVRVWTPGTYWLAVSAQPFPGAMKPAIAAIGPAWQLEVSDGAHAQTHPTVALLRHTFQFDTDLTHVLNVSGLSAGTRYYCAVLATGTQKRLWELGGQEPCGFRTATDMAGALTFGLYSCHMPYTDTGGIKNMQMWSAFAEALTDRNADFVIGGGDQVYTDGNKKISIWRWLRKIKEQLPSDPAERHAIMLSWYRDIYRGYWGHPHMQPVFRNFPHYMIWDDHEIMDGWGSYTNKELSNELDTLWTWENRGKNLALAHAMFAAATQVYTEYQHSHNPPTAADTFDYAFNRGGCAFYVLDMRGQRDYNRKSCKVLGEEQLQRFLDWIASAPVQTARALFIVSSVPVVHATSFFVNKLDIAQLGLADDLRDEWEHETNWSERDRMLQAVFAASRARGQKVVFLSGDVHIGAAFSLASTKYAGARVYQLTSSAITYANAPGQLLSLLTRQSGELGGRANSPAGRIGFNRLHVFNRCNFGLIHVADGTGPDAAISWDLYGASEREDEVVKLKRLELD